MFSSRRFKTWNIFDSALIKNANGHHYWETKGLADELMRRGETVRLFSHRIAPTADEFPGVLISPVFSLYLYRSISNDPAWSTLENFVVHNRAFSHELSSLDPVLFRDSVVLFPTVGASQLLGIFRWLGGFASENRPKAAVCLIPPGTGLRTDQPEEIYKKVWNSCPPALKEGIVLFGRTPQIAKMCVTQAGMPLHVYPYPVPDELVAARRSPSPAPGDPMVVSFVGGARRERGGDLLPDVVKQCSGSEVRFFIQARHGGDSDFNEQTLTALASFPNVAVHEGALERSAYYGALANSVVLLAYQASRYRWRDSGVYHEAKLLDAPMLVSAGTWMAEEVTSLGNGLVIEDHSAASIADCIARAQREFPVLKAAAVRVGKDARERNGVARCIDAIAGRFTMAGVEEP